MRSTVAFHLHVSAAAAFGLIGSPALAGPIVASSGGYWGIQIYDTDVWCGTRCDTDEYQYAMFEYYDLLGTNGVVREAESGPAYASLSVFGIGSEFSSDDAYEYQLTIARTGYASVSADAPETAFARAQAGLTGLFGFALTATARYSGTPFSLFNYGVLTEGTILGPGSYEGFFGSTFDWFSTDFVRAGDHDFRSDLDTFRFRVDSVAVPEPRSLALLAAALIPLLGRKHRRSVDRPED